MNRKTIAVYMPYFMGGGAEAVALWILEALQKTYDLTVFTFYDVDWLRLDKMYDTSLVNAGIKTVFILPQKMQSLAETFISNNRHFRQFSIHLTLRYFKEKASEYDLVLSAFNAADMGAVGIQYIHWIEVLEGGKVNKTIPYTKISNFSVERLKKNISISNSFDVAKAVRDVYKIDSRVIYPPVVIPIKNMTWEQKEEAFVISGRLTVDKAPDFGIKVLKKVRERGFPVKLYITSGGKNNYAQKYQRYVEKLIEENSDWIQLYKNLPYSDYCDVLYRCKYGLHPKKDQFGISVAEMIRAGIIPFVQQIGGQTEIVGKHNIALQFNNIDEAVDKIIAVISDTQKQQELLTSLHQQQELFSAEKFQAEIRDVVDNYFSSCL